MLKCMEVNQLELDGIISCMIVSLEMIADIFLSLLFMLCRFPVGLQDVLCAMVLGTDARFGNAEPGRRKETWNVPLNFQFGHKVKHISCVN